MRISDWSSDVCSSDLAVGRHKSILPPAPVPHPASQAPLRSLSLENSFRKVETGQARLPSASPLQSPADSFRPWQEVPALEERRMTYGLAPHQRIRFSPSRKRLSA